ncbi:hypothetical protein SEVIR_4G193026v4 [Setaria viridis]
MTRRNRRGRRQISFLLSQSCERAPPWISAPVVFKPDTSCVLAFAWTASTSGQGTLPFSTRHSALNPSSSPPYDPTPPRRGESNRGGLEEREGETGFPLGRLLDPFSAPSSLKQGTGVNSGDRNSRHQGAVSTFAALCQAAAACQRDVSVEDGFLTRFFWCRSHGRSRRKLGPGTERRAVRAP